MTSFYPLDVMDKISVSNLIYKIDKCNGYAIDASSEESSDIRDTIFRQGGPSNTLTKFEAKVEIDEEEKMKRELNLFERLAKGEITEEEMEAELEKMG